MFNFLIISGTLIKSDFNSKRQSYYFMPNYRLKYHLPYPISFVSDLEGFDRAHLPDRDCFLHLDRMNEYGNELCGLF